MYVLYFPHFACNTGLALSFRPKFQSKILLLKFTFHLLSKFTLPVRAQIFFENLSYSSFFYKFLSKFNFLSLSFPSKRIFLHKCTVKITGFTLFPIQISQAYLYRQGMLWYLDLHDSFLRKNRFSIFFFFLSNRITPIWPRINTTVTSILEVQFHFIPLLKRSYPFLSFLVQNINILWIKDSDVYSRFIWYPVF